MGRVSKDLMQFAEKAKSMMNREENVIWFASRVGLYPQSLLALRWGEHMRDLLVLDVSEDLGIVLEEWLAAPKPVSIRPAVSMIKSPADTLAYIDSIIMATEQEMGAPSASPDRSRETCGALLEMLQQIRKELFGGAQTSVPAGELPPGVN